VAAGAKIVHRPDARDQRVQVGDLNIAGVVVRPGGGRKRDAVLAADVVALGGRARRSTQDPDQRALLLMHAHADVDEGNTGFLQRLHDCVLQLA